MSLDQIAYSWSITALVGISFHRWPYARTLSRQKLSSRLLAGQLSVFLRLVVPSFLVLHSFLPINTIFVMIRPAVPRFALLFEPVSIRDTQYRS